MTLMILKVIKTSLISLNMISRKAKFFKNLKQWRLKFKKEENHFQILKKKPYLINHLNSAFYLIN